MTAMNFKIINSLRFNSLYNWSVLYKGSNEKNYSQKFPLKRIGDFLFRDKTPIGIQDDIVYKRVRAKWYGEGIKIRDSVSGKEIKTKSQFLIKKGQFLLSKIDARNGAFGVVPVECEGAIITGNFWTFDVDYEQINPYYLKLFTSTKHFQELCQRASNGTTNRNYLQEELFLNMEVPFPDLDTQNQLVNHYNKNLAKAQKAENQANEFEKNIESYLLEELGVEKTKVVERKRGLQFMRAKELSRWDYLYLTNDFELNHQYPQQSLSYFIDN
jgi:type I restriction enzyme, S subunit